MNKQEFKYLITNARYYTKYEPIIDTRSGYIFAYEALSKFDVNGSVLTTEEIFRQLHNNNRLFFELEKRNKRHQVENYPQDKKLFLNFDADIVVSKEQQTYWEKFLTNHKKNIVVEITENGNDDETSALIMKNFSSWLKQREIAIALDDFAQDGSMFSFFIMNNSRYIKIDKSFLRQIEKNQNYIFYLEGLLKTIRANNQKSIVEGVETKDDFELLKGLKCDYMQGYFFNDDVIIV